MLETPKTREILITIVSILILLYVSARYPLADDVTSEIENFVRGKSDAELEEVSRYLCANTFSAVSLANVPDSTGKITYLDPLGRDKFSGTTLYLNLSTTGSLDALSNQFIKINAGTTTKEDFESVMGDMLGYASRYVSIQQSETVTPDGNSLAVVYRYAIELPLENNLDPICYVLVDIMTKKHEDKNIIVGVAPGGSSLPHAFAYYADLSQLSGSDVTVEFLSYASRLAEQEETDPGVSGQKL